jgi:DNA-directed RNA polymerase subunit D
MDLQILENNDIRLSFIIKGLSIEMINAIRRIILTECPVMALTEIIILKNDSPLYDEIIAHRLGLIPLKTDLEIYKLPSECDCGGFGCPLCQVSLTCEITNTANKPITVFSGDLVSNDPKIIPVDPKIPILKLDRNSKFIIEAYGNLGIAKEHVRHQAVSNVAYRYLPIIEFNEKEFKNEEENQLIVSLCPKILFEISSKGSLSLKEDYWKTCSLCKACEENSNEKIKVSWEDESYIFTIESDGVLPFNVLIKKIFEIFNDKINEFVTKLEELEIES